MIPILFLFLITRASAEVSEDLCDRDISLDISNGSVVNKQIIFEGITYGEGEHFRDNETSVEQGCVCLKRTCLRKCCRFGFAYQPIKRQCVPWDVPFDPPLRDEYSNPMERVRVTNETFNFVFGLVNCKKWDGSFRFRASKAFDEFHLRTDGRLFVELEYGTPAFALRAVDKYCMDTFLEDGHGKLDALVCFTDNPDRHNYVLSSACMLVSTVFLLATLLVYGCLPELRNMHGRVLMGYLSCLLVGFVAMAAVQIMLLAKTNYRGTCVVMTFIVYFFLLAAFFWLNVMCFDIWWTFSGKRGLSLEKLSTRGRFLAYCAYAFGVPTALTALLAIMEFCVPRGRFTPQIRIGGTCFLDDRARLLYFYAPILVLCITNTVFFALTALRIATVSKQTQVLKSNESARHDSCRGDKQRLFLYVKIFTVMGVSWILEVISAIWPDFELLWSITDTYNVLMGVIIFIIFVCKRKIFRLIKKRYSQFRGRPMSRSQTATSRTLSSRDEFHMNSVKHNN